MLKFLSSHRGLTYVSLHREPDVALTSGSHELFDEYSRRQFLAKAPEKNPFGSEETPAKFVDFDVFTKVHSMPGRIVGKPLTTLQSQIRVLQLMTQLIMMNPERLRERTDEQKDADQTSWVCTFRTMV